MPIYMDRHNMAEGMTAQDIEQAHHADMEIQDEHNVSFLTYWFDQKAGCVFCLVDSPDEESIKHVHGASHGSIPDDIVEVDLKNVQAFLGRISDPPADAEGRVRVDSPFRSILFTDLKGSTDMTTTMGDADAVALFGVHDEIVRAEIIAHQGLEIKHTGDGFMVSFVEVADSVRCAIAIQQAFKTYNESGVATTLHVRIGINAGQPIERGNDLFGITVQLAARICDHCEADRILAAGVIPEFLSEEPALKTKFNEADKVYFKGFAHAIQIFEISW